MCMCVQHLNTCKTSTFWHRPWMQGPSDFRFSLKWHGAKPRTPALYRSFRNHRLCYFPLQALHTAWFPQSGCIDLFHLFVVGLWSDLCRDVRIRLGYGNCTWRFDDCSGSTFGVIYLWVSLWFRSCSTCLFCFLVIDYFTSWTNRLGKPCLTLSEFLHVHRIPLGRDLL